MVYFMSPQQVIPAMCMYALDCQPVRRQRLIIHSQGVDGERIGGTKFVMPPVVMRAWNPATHAPI